MAVISDLTTYVANKFSTDAKLISKLSNNRGEFLIEYATKMRE